MKIKLFAFLSLLLISHQAYCWSLGDFVQIQVESNNKPQNQSTAVPNNGNGASSTPPHTSETKAAQIDTENLNPFTTQEIISGIQAYLNDDGVYEINLNSGPQQDLIGQAFNWRRVSDYNKANFGTCGNFYIQFARPELFNHSQGTMVFYLTLRKLFGNRDNPEGRIKDENSISKIMSELEKSNPGCGSPEEYASYLARLNDLINTINQSAPSILSERASVVAAKNQAKQKWAQDEQEKTRAWIAHQQKIEACQNSNPYKLYQYAAIIVNNEAIKEKAQMEINQQREGEKISGYVDKEVMYRAGNVIAKVNRANSDNFKEYKNLGGTAKSITAVQAMPDPCNM